MEFVCFFGVVVGACGDWGGGFVVKGVVVSSCFLFLSGSGCFFYFSGSEPFLPKRCCESGCGRLDWLDIRLTALLKGAGS